MGTTFFQAWSERARTSSDLPEALLLEDEEKVAYTFQHLLDSQGFQVTHVPDGAAALRALLDNDFDLILCDMITPKISGEMLYRAVQRTRPHLCERFLFTTGHKADPKIDAFVRLVSGLILYKPFTLEELKEATSTILGRRHVSRQMAQTVPERPLGPRDGDAGRPGTRLLSDDPPQATQTRRKWRFHIRTPAPPG